MDPRHAPGTAFERDIVLRSPWWMRAAPVPLLIFLAVQLALGVADSAFERIYYATAVALLGIGLAQALRARVVIDLVGITAYPENLRRRRVEWADIVRLEHRGFWHGVGAWTTGSGWVHLRAFGVQQRQANLLVVRLDAIGREAAWIRSHQQPQLSQPYWA